MKNWVEISEERLAENYRLLTETAGENAAVLGVVKANAYGHGLAVCARVLMRAGCGWLGVTDAVEGQVVRDALSGPSAEPQPRLLVMSGMLREDAREIVRLGLVPVVWTRQQLEWLVEAATRQGVGEVQVHIEIDSGMARQGIAPGAELDELLAWMREQPKLRLNGVMTHFASSEVAVSHQTAVQRQRFGEAIESVRAAGLRPEWVHAGNSSTVDNADAAQTLEWVRDVAAWIGAKPMVRTGIALYGYCLPIENECGETESRVRAAIRPVLTWKTRIIGIREIGAGESVGYNGIWTAKKPMRLALLPVGYAEGLRRELSGADKREGGWVMIGGERAPIAGRVSMNLTVVDVTAISGVEVGDEVVVLGDGVTADDHARLARTIPYEILCGIKT